MPELVQSLYRGYASEATTMLPSFVPGYSSDVQQVAYDPEAAAATLAEKGVTEIYMVAYTNPRPYNTATGQTLAEAIQGYWDKVGVKCTIDAYAWTTYIDKYNTGDFDVCLLGWTRNIAYLNHYLNLLDNDDNRIHLHH